MGAATVLLIGRNQARRAAAIFKLDNRYHILTASNGKQALALVARQSVDALVLDAVSMRTPGDRIVAHMRAQLPTIPLLLIAEHSASTALASALLTPPVKAQHVVSALAALIQTEAGDMLTCGPFALDMGRRVLLVNGNETQLNPKQALLLELFMRQPGQTIDRKTLMEKVWYTDYLGDTRTLEVHIRWIRQAIELRPSQPRYLKTVRGVGYRLELPPEMHAN